MKSYSESFRELQKEKDWQKKYKKIIFYGKALSPFPKDLKRPEFLVKGCQSQVWLFAQKKEDGRVYFQGSSDALIVQGLLALLLSVFNGKNPEEILEISPDFLKELGLDSHLSPNRANGLYAMLKQIRYYAQAFHLIGLKGGSENG